MRLDQFPSFEVVTSSEKSPAIVRVRATWPNGQVRWIRGFASEEIAEEWIAKVATTWLRNLQRPR
jgi:hypothetical protein